MDYEEESSVNEIAVGDRVWWQRGAGVRNMYDLTATPDHMTRTLRVGSSVLCGRVRAIAFEEPDYTFAVIAADPDGRILQVPLQWLVKGMPPDPIPVVSQESQKEEAQPDDAAATIVNLDVREAVLPS